MMSQAHASQRKSAGLLGFAPLGIAGLVLSAAIFSEPVAAESYPDWSGQWQRVGSLDFPPEGYANAGPPPLIDEYLEKWEAARAQAEAGIPAGDPTAQCLPPGMPRIMKMSMPMEIIVQPGITYIYAEWDSQLRRVYTDGRSFPDYIFPSFNGYSIGEWRDEDDDGVYDALFIETRGLTSPRTFDWTGAPLHENGETVVLEEIRLLEDGSLENTMTTIDDALTEDWTIRQRYERNQGQVVWTGHVCVEEPRYFQLGEYWYRLNPEGYTIEPANADQPPIVPAE